MTDNPTIRIALPLYLALGVGIAWHHRWAGERRAAAPHGVVVGLGLVAEDADRMGFRLPDAQYLASIPEAARRVPESLPDGSYFFRTAMDRDRTRKDRRWVSSKPGVLSFRAYETSPDGEYVLRKIAYARKGDYDQWYLLDVPRFIRAVISVHRQTKRAYYFEIREYDGPHGASFFGTSGKENCYSCHPTGLRKILPRDGDPEAAPDLLAELNARIEDTGLVDLGGDLDFADHGGAIEACDERHDGTDRGRLYPTHYRAVSFKLRVLKAMPPYDPLEADEAEPLLQALREARGDLLGTRQQCDRLIPHLDAIARATPGVTARFELEACLGRETPTMVRCLLDAQDWGGVRACWRAHRA